MATFYSKYDISHDNFHAPHTVDLAPFLYVKIGDDVVTRIDQNVTFVSMILPIAATA